MMNLRPFQLALLVGFGLLGLLGLGLLAGYRPTSEDTGPAIGQVDIWGTLEAAAFNATLRPYVESSSAYGNIRYTQVKAETFENDLLNALAENRGPDLLLIPHEELVLYRTKLQPISYDSFSQRDFKNLYIDGAEIFALQDGLYAFPIAIDPLVMYWNRDILATKNIITAPSTWESVVSTIVPTFVERDFNRNVSRSPIAFGEYRNVKNAAAILSMLTIQGGSQLVTEGRENTYQVALNTSANSTRPLESALTFYTNFASPSNPLYTWNRSKSLDRDGFLAGDVILYFGKGSEATYLAQQNPNLNFDIAEVPQGATATTRRTYGSFYGLALLRASDNKNGAYTVMQLVGSSDFVNAYATRLGMAPTYRSLLLAGSNDTYGRIIYRAAVVARGWLSPKPASVDSIFTQMVEDVLANRTRPTGAASDAVGRLGQAY